MTADCDGLVDEDSVELDELLVELDEIDVEFCDVDDGSLVFSMDFSTVELVCVEEGVETVDDLSEFTPIRISRRIKILHLHQLNMELIFLFSVPLGLMV